MSPGLCSGKAGLQEGRGTKVGCLGRKRLPCTHSQLFLPMFLHLHESKESLTMGADPQTRTERHAGPGREGQSRGSAFLITSRKAEQMEVETPICRHQQDSRKGSLISGKGVVSSNWRKLSWRRSSACTIPREIPKNRQLPHRVCDNHITIKQPVLRQLLPISQKSC